MRKIFFAISRADVIGGAQVHVITLAQIARDANYHVSIVSGHSSGDLVDWCTSLDFEYIYSPGLSNNASFLSTFNSFLYFVDLYHSFPSAIFSLHSSKVGFIARLASLFAHPRLIFTVHGWGYTNQLKTFKGLIVYLCEIIASIISLVKSQISVYVSLFDFQHRPLSFISPTSNQKVIYNSVIDRNQPTLSMPHFEMNKVLKICMIGRFTLQKDQSSLIRAMSLVDGAELFLIGDGPLLNDCVQLVDDLGINQRVHFLGRLSNADTINVLSSCDIYALISNWEGLPRSIIEALSFGLPILATDVGGCNELFVSEGDFSNGVLIPNNNPVTLSKAINFLINSPEFLRKASFLSRAHYQKKFNMQIFASHYLDLWSTLTF